MKLFTDNQVDIATVSCSDASVNYPASNVKDSRLTKIFKGDTNIDFDIRGAGAPKEIYQAFTNLVQDPTDLTTGNWSNSNTTDEISTKSINGNLFTKITNVGANAGYIQQTLTDSFNNLILTGQIILKKGNSINNKTELRIYNSTAGGELFKIFPDWDNFGSLPATPTNGTLLDYEWYDSETLKLNFQCVALANLTDDILFRCYGSSNATDGEYTYWTEVQLIDEAEITMFPFVDGTHAADVINEAFEMPDRFTIDMIIEPKFAFDTTSDKYIFRWEIDGTNYFSLEYYQDYNQILLRFGESGVIAYMRSQIFDDGTSLTNLNQRLRIIGSLELTTGGINDSRFIVIPQSHGSISEDTSWTNVMTIKSLNFPTLSIGNKSGTSQADSEYEYLRIYSGLLVGAVNSSDDVTTLLAEKTILLDKTYQQKLTATDIIIANSTIRDGDVITLRANAVDSFGSGSPVDETITWSEGMTLHSFTKATYQMWRLSIASANIVSIGRIFLGESLTTPNLGTDVSDSYQTDTVKTRTPGGVTYGDLRDNYQLVSVQWPKILTATEKPLLKEAFDDVSISTPLFVMFDEATIGLGTIYATIDGNGLHFVYLRNPVYSKASISFIQEK